MNTVITYFVSTFYKFKPIPNIEEIKSKMEAQAEKDQVRGLIILGTEGFNATVSSFDQQGLENFKSFIRTEMQEPELFFKDSTSPDVSPFRRFKVKLRSEIVTLGTPELHPETENNFHLSPEEWDQVLKNEKDFLLIDTRNWYETKIGTFNGAINPGIDKFTEFPQWMKNNNYNKDKKILIFCTGGIRCEKGILELQEQGYNNVYQLYGGIINYLDKKPNSEFNGECFVFDHRVALDQDLKPTQKYGLCPHCGQPSMVEIECKRCDTHELICDDCAKVEFKKDTCTKNCAYQYEKHPGVKSPRQMIPHELEKQKDRENHNAKLRLN